MWGVFLNLFRCLWGLCSPSSLEMERNEPTRSDPNFGASSSSTSLLVGDYEGGTKKMEENDYEVFLSFRGKDTRNGFTAHLYTSLANAPIRVFRDDNELRVGEKIGPELIRSITQSKISIPIISEDYASSKWCLRELALMLNCRRNKGQMVLPIFYKVEPQQVKHLTGRFGDAIRTHKRNSEENIVKEWEEALKEVTSLKGWESKKIDNGNEATLVETVVKSIVRELKSLFLLDLPKHLVGIDDQLSNIMGFIDAKFSDTRVIGIYGMGGIGKTTLAMALYNKLFSHYEYHSFVLNIRETSMREGKGIEHVQKKLFCDITKKSWDAYDVNEGIRILESRLTSKKVLILLDDVDDNTHLKALIGDKSWFETGSIVIITTRNKSILKKASADYTHLLEGLPSNLSLILFSRHAFRKDSPPSDYEKISHALVSTTNGLPLAIEVIASQLGGESMEKWKYTLKKLKEVPAMEVQNRLRISYEALDDRDKHIFLDIACFFIGKSQQNPIYMWDACGFFPRSGIEELSHRSLIKIDGDGKFMMHDQLRDLGREIVRLEELTVPRNRSRLWSEEAKCVLDGNIGTSKIEALCLDLIYGTRRYTTEVFKELTNLRFLQLHGVNLTGNFQNLLPQLRWLEWTGKHSDFELTNFCLEKLVVLNLSWDRTLWHQTLKDWRGWNPLKMATELRVLKLSSCALRTTPDLSAFKSLEILKLDHCLGLEEIHPSIEDIKTLISLNVNYCRNLKELPLGVGRMKELRELLIANTNIREIPISRGCLTKLETLDVSNCESLARIPNSIGDLASLSHLDLRNCQELTQLPNSIGSLVSLSRLSLQLCYSLRQIPDLIGKLTSLTELQLKFTAIEELPESIGSLKKLQTLNVSYCESLARIPNSIGDLASLSHLDLRNCRELTQLPNSIGSLVSLSQLSLQRCYSLRQIPDLIGKLTLLTELQLKFTAIEELPESIGSLKKLQTLDVSYCKSLARIPNSIGDLTSLSHLNLENCQKLTQLPDSIGSLVSLSLLSLRECRSLRQIPDLIGKLTSLTELQLKFTAIEELPESIGSLKKLQTLDVSYCASLARIPNSIGDLASLFHFDLGNCLKLTQLPNSIGSLVSLSRLLLQGCCSLRQIPDLIGKLTLLTELHLKSTAIEELPESIGSLKKLKTLDVSYCASLAHIPSSISDLTSLSHLNLENCQKLTQLPDSIGSLVSLSLLSLRECRSLRQIPDLIGKLTSLTELQLKFTAIEELPESIGSLKKLKTLDVSYCASLAHIPNSIGDLSSLSHLDLGNCLKLTQLPDSIGSLVSLSLLSLRECRSLRQIPDLIGKLISLTELRLTSLAIEELPESIGSLKKLKTLDVSYCASLTRIPNSIGDLASLSKLDLTGCQKLALLPDSIGSLMSLWMLLLSRCHSLRQIPDSIGKLTSLTELHLNYTAIGELPKSIGNMQNLRMLDINGTPIIELLDIRGIEAELQGLKALGWKDLEGPPSNNGQLVLQHNLDLDMHKKLSELHSCILTLVLLKCPKTSPANNSAMDYQMADSKHGLKRSRPFGISNEDSESMADVKPGIADDSGDKSRNWKPTEINEPQCRSIRLPDNSTAMRVPRLSYTNSGRAILVLSSNAVHKLWKWEESDQNLTGRATTSVVPQLWQPPGGNLMTNETCANPEDAVQCFALSKDESRLISASGGMISCFNMETFKTLKKFTPLPPPNNDIIEIGMEDSAIQIYSARVDKIEKKLKGHRRIIKGFTFSTSLNVLVSATADSQMMTTFLPHPPSATFLAIDPRDNYTIAIGMEDSSIQIYRISPRECEANLKGHQKRITGLAFSNALNVLVSSGADSQLCVWRTDGWEKQASTFLQMPLGRAVVPLANTRVQFHMNQTHLLVVHETQIATYEAPELECLRQWDTREASTPITDATYSCNSQSIYVSFEDGSIGVLIAHTLKLRCRINPAAYIPPNPGLRVYPIVIAAHPSEPNQFALGLTDGSVHVLEPLESEGKWGTSPFVRRKRNRVRLTPKEVRPRLSPRKGELHLPFISSFPRKRKLHLPYTLLL